MKRKRHENLATVGLALCVAILALLAAFMDVDGVSTVQGANAKETPLIAVEFTPLPVPRYSSVAMSEDERRELAGIIHLEAGNQCAEGQQAVAEVVLNRCRSTIDIGQ